MKRLHLLLVASLGSGLLAFYRWKKPKPEVRKGEAWDGKALRVVLLPADCSSPDEVCEDAFVEVLTGKVASELEFAGYSVVEASALVAKARTRDEKEGELAVLGVKLTETKSKRQVGSLFADLSPAGQRALLEEAGAAGIVSGKISVGAKNGLSPTRESTVLVRLGLGDGTELGWVSRCTVKSSLNPPLGQSLDDGGDCAIQGALTGKFSGK